MKKVMSVLFFTLLAGVANAIPVTNSSGDLGNNVVNNAGYFEVLLNADTPSNVFASTIDIKYGLWNSPSVNVSVFFNSNLVGNLIADAGYSSPGPKNITFDISGLLLNGLNKISFDGFGANGGDYVIGKVDMNYDNLGSASVPEPASIALLGLGLAGFGFSRRKKSA